MALQFVNVNVACAVKHFEWSVKTRQVLEKELALNISPYIQSDYCKAIHSFNTNFRCVRQHEDFSSMWKCQFVCFHIQYELFH